MLIRRGKLADRDAHLIDAIRNALAALLPEEAEKY